MGAADPDELVERVFQALCDGRLGRDDLSARRIAAFLGQTTMVLYHHFGSIEGFLIRVDGAGWKLLVARLAARARAGDGAGELATEYLRFAFRHPDLYWVMAERRFDRKRLRDEGRLSLAHPLLGAFVEMVRAHGSAQPSEDTPVLFAGLHGLAMLTLSGRANIGEAPGADEEAAFAAARRLAALVFSKPAATSEGGEGEGEREKGRAPPRRSPRRQS